MKRYSIRELHQSTGAIVRESAEESVIITDQNRPIAVIKPVSAEDLAGRALPAGHWERNRRPNVESDSTEIASEDRDR